jgi:hypothetical protein
MAKPKTDAKRKREKPQEAATKGERCKWDPSYCAHGGSGAREQWYASTDATVDAG